MRGSGSPRYAARAAYLFLASVLLTGACTGSPNSPSPTEAAGGTLRLLYDQTITTWDPQRFRATMAELQRRLYAEAA